MPIYEYLCDRGHRFERVVTWTDYDEPISEVPCPEQAPNPQFTCRRPAKLVPSKTGKPILKKGIGGFHAPNA